MDWEFCCVIGTISIDLNVLDVNLNTITFAVIISSVSCACNNHVVEVVFPFEIPRKIF